jgi:hypothetical protein
VEVSKKLAGGHVLTVLYLRVTGGSYPSLHTQTKIDILMTANEARSKLNASNAYFELVLEDIFKEVEHNCQKGQNWAHVSIDRKDNDPFVSRVKDQLIRKGYKVHGESYQFRIEW